MPKQKKERRPSPIDSPNFEIPTLANDPNFPGEEIVVDTTQQVEIGRGAIFAPPPKKEFYRGAALVPQPPKEVTRPQVVTRDEEDDELNLDLTPETAMNAFVLTEILSKPKALRRRAAT